MPKKPARTDTRVSLAPLTPDQALSAALRVKPADLKKLEAAEKKVGKGKASKRRA